MISNELKNNLQNSSWIRKMFEEGNELKQKFGSDNVFDFSLGNPEFEPPEVVYDTLKSLVDSENRGIHRYMSNAGFLDVRKKIADNLNKTLHSPMSPNQIVMTCGAAGGLNICLKTILNPDEEVIIFSPFFSEYKFYISNHGGKTVIVPTDKETFQPDLVALENSITPKTKAIIINSPNNPTGVIYKEEVLIEMSKLICFKENEFNSNILLISDEPYTKIVYDNISVPNILNIFKNSVVVNSFSKSLGLPGERIGYVAINNEVNNIDLFINGLVFANRTLGYVNAPALFQKVIANSLEETVNIEGYKERRDLFYNMLTELGFSCIKPDGAFYLFPKALIEDDVEFVLKAKEFNLLMVPGSGFGCPGHFRLAYCVDMNAIKNSYESFKKLGEYYNK